MSLKNLIDILPVYIAVPDRFGVDDQHRPLVTTVETAGAIDANIFPTGNRLALLFGIVAQLLSAMFAAAVRAIFAEIGAEEDVVIVIGHIKWKVMGQNRLAVAILVQ